MCLSLCLLSFRAPRRRSGDSVQPANVNTGPRNSPFLPQATATKKSVKLAPFKLRFSKMLKSRSTGDNRSNSVETEEQQRQVDRSSLPSDEYADAVETKMDRNCLSVRNEQTIPSSPPPSYEHVLEEVSVVSQRLERTDFCARS